MIKVSVFYPNSKGSKFDMAYYTSKHMPMVQAKCGKAGHRVVKEPYDAFWGQRYATVHDPDGNAVDLYAALPG